MKITKANLIAKYGIDLPFGKYQIYTNGDSYRIYNVKDDTEGCILLGQTRNKDSIGNSRLAVDKLFNQVELAINNKEPVEIKIE
jgi:hypothetical protein